MRNIGLIVKRELGGYFGSPVAYVIIALFLLVMGFLFAASVNTFQQATLEPVFMNISFVLLLVAPILTMRLLSEEQRTGTIELMLTAPLRDVEMVLGKFLASIGFLAAMLAPTLWYAIALAVLGNPDPGPLLTGYLGTLLLGASFMSVGLLSSSLSQNQIVSAFIGFGILLLLYLIEYAGNFFGGSLQAMLSYIAIAPHLASLSKGVVDTTDIVYYLSLIVTSLFVTTSVVQIRRWR